MDRKVGEVSHAPDPHKLYQKESATDTSRTKPVASRVNTSLFDPGLEAAKRIGEIRPLRVFIFDA